MTDKEPPLFTDLPAPEIAGFPYVGRLIIRDTFNACKSCGNLFFNLTEPKGPHSYGLRCGQCGKHAGWIGKAEAEDIPHLLAYP